MGRKRRKVELRPRSFRYAHQYEEGDIRAIRLDPNKSPWWQLLEHPDVYDENSSAGKKFRHKFRLTRTMVDDLVAEASKVEKWADKEAGPGHGRGPPRHPLILKVLAALRHLGKGMDPESLEDCAQISESTLDVFCPLMELWVV